MRVYASGIDTLQCGRIYKDAEIRKASPHSGGPHSLQCGRIYKDAEIRPRRCLADASPPGLQCGRIYKDAEIRSYGTMLLNHSPPSMWPHL